MAIREVDVPLYSCLGVEKETKLTISCFNDRVDLSITSKGMTVSVECYFDDLERAWEAVKP